MSNNPNKELEWVNQTILAFTYEITFIEEKLKDPKISNEKDYYKSQLKSFKEIIERLNNIKKVLEKETPKEVDIWQRSSLDNIHFYCPNCSKELDKETEYCPYCGQKLDYSSYYGDDNEQ